MNGLVNRGGSLLFLELKTGRERSVSKVVRVDFHHRKMRITLTLSIRGKQLRGLMESELVRVV